jgi:hypothetical protein
MIEQLNYVNQRYFKSPALIALTTLHILNTRLYTQALSPMASIDIVQRSQISHTPNRTLRTVIKFLAFLRCTVEQRSQISHISHNRNGALHAGINSLAFLDIVQRSQILHYILETGIYAQA